MNQINMQVEQKLSRCKKICQFCEKEFETNDIYTYPQCPECDEKEIKAKKEKQCQIHLQIIPPKYRNQEFENKKILDKLLYKSVFITGSSGTGKTMLMATLAKRYLREGKKIKWINFPAFIMIIQSMFRTNHKDEDPYDYAKEIATSEDILAIDDLGAEKLTEFVRQIMYYIINEREQRQLPTLITSNFSLKKIDEMIDSRISSRITGMCQSIQLSGRDKRLNEKNFDFNKKGGD